jgi:hypothetical protein
VTQHARGSNPVKSAVIERETLDVPHLELDRRAGAGYPLDCLRHHELAAVYSDHTARGTDQRPQGEGVSAGAATCFEDGSPGLDSQHLERTRIDTAKVPSGDGIEESNQSAGICGLVDTGEGLNGLCSVHAFANPC